MAWRRPVVAAPAIGPREITIAGSSGDGRRPRNGLRLSRASSASRPPSSRRQNSAWAGARDDSSVVGASYARANSRFTPLADGALTQSAPRTTARSARADSFYFGDAARRNP